MKKFTDETLKELVIYLRKRDLNTNTSIAGMLDEIRDWAEDNDIENDVEVEELVNEDAIIEDTISEDEEEIQVS